MDQVGEKSNGAGEDKNGELKRRRDCENREADRNRFDALARPNDRAIDQPMRMAMTAVRTAVVGVPVVMVVAAWSYCRVSGRGRRDRDRC